MEVDAQMRVIDENLLKKVYEYVVEYQRTEGRTPAYRKIMHDLDISSMSVVYRYVTELKDRDMLTTDDKGPWSSIAIPLNLLSDRVDNTSLVGEVACGDPTLAVENIMGNFPLPVGIFGTGEKFMLTAKGYSMIEKGISPGDLLVVRKQNYADSGQVVIALLDDEATAKIYIPRKDYAILRPANSNVNENGERLYKDRRVTNVEILGVVTNVIKKM
jgi:repressor LexA